MTQKQHTDIPQQLTDYEKQFQQVDVTLFGRFMTEDKQEFPCQVTALSPGNAVIDAPQQVVEGSRIIAYIDHLGRIEGKVLRTEVGSFSMAINATEHLRDKLAAKITWIANRHELNLPEDRRHERIIPKSSFTEIKLEDGRSYTARIIDLSLSGAAIAIDVRPAIGTLMWLGNIRGRIIRHFDEGVAIEFALLQTHDTLQNYIDRREL